MRPLRKIVIDERDYRYPSDLMDALKRELGFPDYFGGNLPALNDCLGDICEDTRITIIRRDPTPDTWFDKVTLAIVRASMENDCLRVHVR